MGEVVEREWQSINLFYILQHLRYLHLWVPFIPLECEAFGKSPKLTYFLHFWISSLPWVNERLSRGRVTKENIFSSHSSVCPGKLQLLESRPWFYIPSTWHLVNTQAVKTEKIKDSSWGRKESCQISQQVPTQTFTFTSQERWHFRSSKVTAFPERGYLNQEDKAHQLKWRQWQYYLSHYRINK